MENNKIGDVLKTSFTTPLGENLCLTIIEEKTLAHLILIENKDIYKDSVLIIEEENYLFVATKSLPIAYNIDIEGSVKYYNLQNIVCTLSKENIDKIKSYFNN